MTSERIHSRKGFVKLSPLRNLNCFNMGLFKRKLKDNDIISSKEIDSNMFKDWPLTCHNVVLQKRGILMTDGKISDKMIYLTLLINGKVYALNGSAADKYKLKSIIDSKYYVRGMQVSDLINYGFDKM